MFIYIYIHTHIYTYIYIYIYIYIVCVVRQRKIRSSVSLDEARYVVFVFELPFRGESLEHGYIRCPPQSRRPGQRQDAVIYIYIYGES